MDVCIDGIVSLFLEPIGGDFIGDADAATFLAHVEDDGFGELGEMALCGFELLTAIATQGVEDVARQAFAVNAHGNVETPFDITANEGDVVEPNAIASECDDLKLPKLRRQIGLGKYF